MHYIGVETDDSYLSGPGGVAIKHFLPKNYLRKISKSITRIRKIQNVTKMDFPKLNKTR